MSHSFHKMWMLLERNVAPDEALGTDDGAEGDKGALLTSGEESVALRAIRNGINLRKEDCGSFWEDFIQVCGDAEGMSELLEVPKEKVTGWPSKVKEILSQVEKKDDQESHDSERAEMISTGGNDGPTASQDERGITYNPPDMRPTP